MAIFGRKPNEQIKYRYKLNENFKAKGGSIGVNGTIFKKDEWQSFNDNKYETFKKYIKSHANPDGILDEYIYDPVKEFNMKEQAKEIKFVHRKKKYTLDSLSIMTRPELEEIAKEYLIETKGKVNKFLIRCIMDEQKKHLTSLEKTDDFFDITNNIPEE